MSKKITIYSTPTCHYCAMAKEYFKEKNLEYTEINVAGDPEKINEMVEISGQRGVPVIVIGDAAMVGFDRSELESALAA